MCSSWWTMVDTGAGVGQTNHEHTRQVCVGAWAPGPRPPAAFQGMVGSCRGWPWAGDRQARPGRQRAASQPHFSGPAKPPEFERRGPSCGPMMQKDARPMMQKGAHLHRSALALPPPGSGEGSRMCSRPCGRRQAAGGRAFGVGQVLATAFAKPSRQASFDGTRRCILQQGLAHQERPASG